MAACDCRSCVTWRAGILRAAFVWRQASPPQPDARRLGGTGRRRMSGRVRNRCCVGSCPGKHGAASGATCRRIHMQVGLGRFGGAHDRTSAPSSWDAIHPASPADQVVRLRGADGVRVYFFARRSTARVRRSTSVSFGSKGPPTHSSLSAWSSWSGSAITSRNSR